MEESDEYENEVDIKSIFNSVTEYNWSWIFLDPEQGWKQFDCLNCMMIEKSYKIMAHSEMKNDLTEKIIKRFERIKLDIGIVNIKNLTLELKNETVKIKRTKNEQRVRPNAWKRQDNTDSQQRKDSDYCLVCEADYEWLSFNWRKYRASKASRSHRRTILIMLDIDYQYFPSLLEIMNGILES